MMTTLEKFNANYEPCRMSRNSMVVRKRQTGEELFIHRKAYNALLDNKCEDWREVDVHFSHDGRSCQTTRWIEVLTWVSI